MFLLRTGFSKQEFVATAVMLAVMVDVSRMLIYGLDLRHHPDLSWPLVTAASLSAFTGAYLGSRMLKKMTIASLQTIISFLLAGIATGLISGML